jgi:hypothetical protein
MPAFPCKYKLPAAFVLMLSFVAVGCADRATNDSRHALNSDLQVNLKDQSLPDTDYIQLGVPAHDRPWSGDDLARAARVLSELAQEHPEQLPRYKSEYSGATFARITSPQNLELLKNRTLPIEARFPQGNAYLGASNQFLKLYLAPFLKRTIRDTDLVEIMGALLRLAAILPALTDEFLHTILKDDPTYAVRMGGLKKMKEGLGNVVMGGLQTLTEKEYYASSERIRLIGYMKETFPTIVPFLLPGTRAETLVRLRGMAKDESLKDLQPDLDELLAVVQRLK